MACAPNEIITDFGCLPVFDPAAFVKRFYGVGLGIIGGVSIIVIIYGGYLILTSQGNPMQLESGKRYVMYAIIGLLFAIFAFVFIQVIAIDILHVPGFNK